MSIKFPDFRETRCVAVGTFGVLETDEKELIGLFSLKNCNYENFLQAKAGEETEQKAEATDWTKLERRLVERLALENRIERAEKEIKEVSDQLTRLEGLSEKAFQKPVCVQISTFAPEPFEVLRDFSVVVQPEEDGFIATLFDANVSTFGDTQEEAVANLKDLTLMIFQDFENEEDSELGPAMIRQKYALLSLIRRK